jgi:hypothetical protein
MEQRASPAQGSIRGRISLALAVVAVIVLWAGYTTLQTLTVLGTSGEIWANYKRLTNPGGVHAFSVFVRKPFIPPAPDGEATAHA